MHAKKKVSIEELAVVGIDIGKETFIWLGLTDPVSWSCASRSSGWPCPRRSNISLVALSEWRRASSSISRYLRMLFAQAPKVIMMRQHRWADFRFGRWLTGAVTRMPRNTAAIASAKELARTA